MSVIDDVKARLDLVEVVAQTVKLRKSGRAYMGLCPFHAHKNNTPSFAVWPDTGTWRCFGQCNEGGDIFKFVMKRDGLDFSGALEQLARLAGVELKPRTPQQAEQDDNLNHLRQLLETAANYYHHLLRNAPQAQPARDHLARRGLTDKAVEAFQLGYALESWDAGLKYFTGKDYSLQDLLDAGLVVAKEVASENPDNPLPPATRYFDRFRHRLMIPVRDEQGRMTGFQARALRDDQLPKFMNSPQTALFDKGRTLFGLHAARRAIRDANAVVVVEGNLDVIAAHQAGFTNVVSSQGTALTEHQLRLLKKHAKRLLLALDADEAGDAATLRGLMVARESLDREAEVRFDPRGLVKVEGRLGADLRVMTLPPGLDPDDVIRSDPDEWRRRVEAAEPIVEYVIRVLTAGRNLDDPKTKAEVADAVLPLIDDVADAIERDAYRQKLARTLRVDEAVLAQRRALRTARRTAGPAHPEPAAASVPPRPPEPEGPAKLEAHCLSALIREPDRRYALDRDLQALGLDRLTEDDFAGSEHQFLFRALVAAQAQVDVEPLDYLRHNLDPALQARLDALLRPAVGPDPGAARLPRADDDLLTIALRLRQRALAQQRQQLRFLQEDAREQGDALAEAHLPEMARLAAAQARVDLALAPRSRRGAAPTRAPI